PDAASWNSDPLSHFMHERGIDLLAKGNRGDGEPQGRGPRDGQQRGQGERKRRIETEQRRNQGADVRAEGVNVLMHDVCGGKLVLDYEESAIIYSNNDQQLQSCSMKVKTPRGTGISFYCSAFNIYDGSCKKEFLQTKYKVNGKKEKVKYCEDLVPGDMEISTNKLTLRYRRRSLKDDQYSGGFICVVTAVGDGRGVTVSSPSLDGPRQQW
ncbi:uncharacterized protein LOC122266250, partial [Penaeus japonicus]|uniref:uncharacterized protein LOC122266250 n=1 Tax=Penaeus japonicus TaxID=27405 RepID=UPI001C70F69B